MPPADVEITDDPARVDLPLLHELLAASYWSPGVPASVVATAVAGSDCVSAHRDGAMIGFARMATDRATFGWIADVVVVESARGNGVGTALVQRLLDRAQDYRLRRVMLATRDAHEIYRRLGFTEPAQNLLMHIARDPATLYSDAGERRVPGV